MPINTENPIQIIRGDKASISVRTGKDGEPNWATDTHELYIHDGVTPGGHKVGGQGETTVPIYEGATDSASGVPGLVPPATPAEKDMYLKGDGTYGTGLSSSDFESPTMDSPGKSGLVPQPQATDPSVQSNNILTMSGWKSLLSAFVMPDVTDSNSKTLCPTVTFIQDLDANSISSGFYRSINWTNAPETTGIILAFQEPNPYEDSYSVRQIFFSYSHNIAFRSTGRLVSSGTSVANAPWEVWRTLGAPEPTSRAGVGQMLDLQGSTGTIRYELPDGGTWYHWCIWESNATGNPVVANTSGLLAGGSTIEPPTTAGVIRMRGWAWRID